MLGKHTFHVQSFCLKKSAVHKITWENIADAGRREATDVLSEYAVLIAFPLQQRLHERASR